MKTLSVLILGIAFCVPIPVFSQGGLLPSKRPSEDAIEAAHKIAEETFSKLKSGKTQELAEWISESVGYNWDASTRIKKTGEFKSQFDIILVSPPASSYGKLDGYDLLDESYLPGTDRYFRLIYMSYHEGAPLMWEFRFYVKPDRKTCLIAVGWDIQNPFEYMTKGRRFPVKALPRVKSKWQNG